MSAAAPNAEPNAPASEPSSPPAASPAATPDAWQATLATLPPELRSDPSLKEVGSVADAVKSYVHAQRMIAKGNIGLPGEKATEGDWQSFFSRLGRPEKPEGYQEALKDWKPPEGLPWQEDLVPKMLENFHKRGLLPQQVRGLIEDYASTQEAFFKAQAEAVEQRRGQVEQELQQKYGAEYEASKDLATRAFKEIFGEQFGEVANTLLADGTTLGDHPAFFDAFVKIGKSIHSHDIQGVKSQTMSISPEQAKAELAKLEGQAAADPKHPLLNKTHAEHDLMVERRRMLIERANPTAPKEDWA